MGVRGEDSAIPAVPAALTLLCDHFEVGEPRLLGQGLWGPVIRARHVYTRELVAVKVFNAQEAYQSGRVAHCRSAHEARARALAAFTLEVRSLQQLTGSQTTISHEDGDSEWLLQLGACPDAVVQMLGFSHDGAGQPSEDADGCCYLVLELGQCTLEELSASKPDPEEIRETMRALFSTLADLHRGGCVLRSHSARHFMRFADGWKLLAASELRPTSFTARTASILNDPHPRTAPWHLAPEYAKSLVGGDRDLILRPSADVWSLAMLCLEMVWGSPLLQETYQQMKSGSQSRDTLFLEWLADGSSPVPLPAAVGNFIVPLRGLMLQLLNRDPEYRADVHAALRHPYLASDRAAGWQGWGASGPKSQRSLALAPSGLAQGRAVAKTSARGNTPGRQRSSLPPRAGASTAPVTEEGSGRRRAVTLDTDSQYAKATQSSSLKAGTPPGSPRGIVSSRVYAHANSAGLTSPRSRSPKAVALSCGRPHAADEQSFMSASRPAGTILKAPPLSGSARMSASASTLPPRGGQPSSFTKSWNLSAKDDDEAFATEHEGVDNLEEWESAISDAARIRDEVNTARAAAEELLAKSLRDSGNAGSKKAAAVREDPSPHQSKASQPALFSPESSDWKRGSTHKKGTRDSGWLTCSTHDSLDTQAQVKALRLHQRSAQAQDPTAAPAAVNLLAAQVTELQADLAAAEKEATAANQKALRLEDELRDRSNRLQQAIVEAEVKVEQVTGERERLELELQGAHAHIKEHIAAATKLQGMLASTQSEAQEKVGAAEAGVQQLRVEKRALKELKEAEAKLRKELAIATVRVDEQSKRAVRAEAELAAIRTDLKLAESVTEENATRRSEHTQAVAQMERTRVDAQTIRRELGHMETVVQTLEAHVEELPRLRVDLKRYKEDNRRLRIESRQPTLDIDGEVDVYQALLQSAKQAEEDEAAAHRANERARESSRELVLERAKVSRAQNDAEQARDFAARQEEKLADALATIDAQVREVDRLQAACDELTARCEAATRKEHRLQQRVNEKIDEKALVQAERKALAAETASVRQLLEAANAKTLRLQAELKKEQERNGKSDGEIERVQQELNRRSALMRSEMVDAQRRAESSRMEVRKLQRDLDQAREEHNETRRRLKNLTSQLKAAETGVSAAKAESAALQDGLRLADHLKSEVKRLREEVHRLEAEASKAHASATQVQAELAAVRKELAIETAEREHAQGGDSSKASEVRALKSQLMEAEQKNIAAQGENERLQLSLAQEKARNAEVLKESQALREVSESQAKVLSQVREELETSKLEHQAASAATRRLQATLDSTRLHGASSELAERQVAEDLRSRLLAAQQEASDSAATAARLEVEAGAALSALLPLQAELEEARIAAAQAHAEAKREAKLRSEMKETLKNETNSRSGSLPISTDDNDDGHMESSCWSEIRVELLEMRMTLDRELEESKLQQPQFVHDQQLAFSHIQLSLESANKLKAQLAVLLELSRQLSVPPPSITCSGPIL
ncbi:hypothetical protein AB1Y20_009038 [Prymnesium parvum]|uniref:Protein kinase domain-containing protein n=1 Tax=Prymnesium parvum TaxID=97485 RepID=A0AB34K367_PRYPA